MIIIAVLGVISILLIMNLQLCSDTLYAERYFSRLQKRETSYYIARSIFKATVKLLEQEQSMGGKVDSLHEAWALNPHEYEIDEGKISINIEDENRFFDLNSIANEEGKVEEKHFKQFQRLLDILEINPYFAETVIDWIDKDLSPTAPGGSEFVKDSKIPCKNAPLDSVEELFHMNNFNDNWYKGSIESGKYKPGLKDVITTYSNGKINVNTASLEVLQSLDKDISHQIAQEIINRRKDRAFSKMEDLLEIPGFNSDLLYRIKYLSDVMSSHFKITIQVDKEGDKTLLTAILLRESGNSKCVFWKVE